MDTEKLWNVFETTGRVEDYLRYRQAVMSAAVGKEEKDNGIDSQGPNHSGTQYR